MLNEAHESLNIFQAFISYRARLKDAAGMQPKTLKGFSLDKNLEMYVTLRFRSQT